MTFVILFLSIFSIVGCDSSGGKAPKKAPAQEDQAENKNDPNFHYVMVIDDGFDIDHPAIKDKIAAAYNLKCDQSENHSKEEDSSYSDYKKSRIKSITEPSGTCELVKLGKMKYSQDLLKIEKYRDSFNKAMLAGEPDRFLDDEPLADFFTIMDTLSGYNAKDPSKSVNYHGTAVSSVIAYKNDNVKLVLIDVELATSSKIESDHCPKQLWLDQLDYELRLHEDEDYLEALYNVKADPVTEKLNQLIEQYDIKLGNGSFGSAHYSKLVNDYKESCGNIEDDFLEEYVNKLRTVDQERAKLSRSYTKDPKMQDKLPATSKALFVQAAGNDFARLDSSDDAERCNDSGSPAILVGSFDQTGDRSTFSNFGNCIDFYASGSDTLVAAPNGFFSYASGTSFATPNLIRFITENSKPGIDVDGILKLLKQSSDNRGYLSQTAKYPTMDLDHKVYQQEMTSEKKNLVDSEESDDFEKDENDFS